MTGLVLLDVAPVRALARSAGAVARWLGEPGVVAEIAVGILLGPSLRSDAATAILLSPLVRSTLSVIAVVRLQADCDWSIPGGHAATKSAYHIMRSP